MTDFFDSLLSLEEDFHKEGYEQGQADGELAGLIEGRLFGLEKGFEKFLELGRMQGRCSVWNSRFSSSADEEKIQHSPPRPDFSITNPRAQKNIQSLALLLTNPPFKNDEDSVEEVEETLKHGRTKTKIVERILREKDDPTVALVSQPGGEQNIEDFVAYMFYDSRK